MKPQELLNTVRALLADGKGLLAMDESNPTCNKRFARLGIPQTVEARRAYRELIVTTPGLGESISGAILYDETKLLHLSGPCRSLGHLHFGRRQGLVQCDHQGALAQDHSHRLGRMVARAPLFKSDGRLGDLLRHG